MGTAITAGRRAERLTAFYAQRPDLNALFAPLIASMEAIEEQLRAYNRLLNDRAKADEVCARLMSVLGVGPITALTYTSTIEDPHRFARSDDVGAYAGIVPRRSQTGARHFSGHISKESYAHTSEIQSLT